MNVIVTGAHGFIGRALVARLLSGPDDLLRTPITRLILLDQHFAERASDPRVHQITGDFGDDRVLEQALAGGADFVFHLASLPGGAAACDFALGMRVNLQATINLLDALRRRAGRPIVVFASSIAVYGVPLPPLIDEETRPEPSLSYGAHKLIGEILVRDYSEREFIDGRALRLPGIVSRPAQLSGLLSQFLSDLIRELSAGRSFTCPVSPGGKSWWMSRPCVVDNLLHAAVLPVASAARRRVWLLPVLHASMGEIVGAIGRARGEDMRQRVRYEPDRALEAQFASYPPLNCPKALAAGFRNDGTLEALVRRSLEEY